jgi:hypothetical protein
MLEKDKSDLNTKLLEKADLDDKDQLIGNNPDATNGSITESELGSKVDNRLFAGTTPLEKPWWIQQAFFTWLTPLVDHSNGEGQISVKDYGNLLEKHRI